MNIESALREMILSSYKSFRAFSLANNLPPTTVTTIFQRGIENASFSNVVTICQALHISVDALAEGEIVQIDEARRPVPALPPHEQSLLDAYRAMSPREQQLVCRMVGIAHPDDTLKKTNRHA